MKTTTAKKCGGLSLLELLVTIAVLSIVTAFAVPSMVGAVEKRRTVTVGEAIYSHIQMARSAAVAKSQPVFINVVDGADWAIGISTDPNCDPVDNNPACTLPDVDNNNAITYLVTAADYPNTVLASSAASTSFQPQRGIATSMTMDVISTGNIGYTLSVRIGLLGQVSMCSSDANPRQHITGYRTCP